MIRILLSAMLFTFFVLEAKGNFSVNEYQDVLYMPIEVGRLGKSENITLHDGSIWTVHPQDREIARRLMPGGDYLIIVPNNEWFPSHHYAFINLKTQDYVRVNLVAGPSHEGVYVRYITAIDKSTGTICLSDDTIWRVVGFDRGATDEWLVEDIIMLGVNNGWFFSSSRPRILINISGLNSFNELSYVRVHREDA